MHHGSGKPNNSTEVNIERGSPHQAPGWSEVRRFESSSPAELGARLDPFAPVPPSDGGRDRGSASERAAARGSVRAACANASGPRANASNISTSVLTIRLFKSMVELFVGVWHDDLQRSNGDRDAVRGAVRAYRIAVPTVPPTVPLSRTFVAGEGPTEVGAANAYVSSWRQRRARDSTAFSTPQRMEY